MYVVLVDFHIKTDQVAPFKKAMLEQAENSLSLEPDCSYFDVCQDPEDPTKFFLYEIYKDAAAFDLHLKSEHFINFDWHVSNWVVEKHVRILERC